MFVMFLGFDKYMYYFYATNPYYLFVMQVTLILNK